MTRTVTFLGAFLPLFATAQLNIELVGTLSYQELRGSNLSNLWGYTDEFGNEYALVGVNGVGTQQPGGISVVDLSVPSDPQEIFFFPGPSSIWREVKVWGDHAYITTEAESGGITIVDLSPLPQSTALNAIVWDAPDWNTSHSLFIDENGRLYIHGADRGNGGVIMYDLTQDPMDPVEVGAFDNWYCHDSFARGDTLYAAHIYDGFFSIVDVSSPASPVLLGTRVTPNEFTHNVWLDDTGTRLFTTDERTDSYVASYDISDPTDIEFLDQLQSDTGSGTIPHNTYWLNDFLVTSYYTYGVTVYDATRPDNLVEVGHYDTSPFSGDGFFGAWGVYPFFASERLIISDIEQGLVVLDPTYVRACWLEGVVTDATNGLPINGADIVLSAPSSPDVTGFDGRYATGSHLGGEHSVTFSAAGYQPQTVPVVLVNGELTVLDVALQPLQLIALEGAVVDAGSGAGIAGARVQFTSGDLAYGALTAGDGGFDLPAIFTGTYASRAGRWGWRTRCDNGVELSPGMGTYVVPLTEGYMDDMALDLGWTVSGTATAGGWERGVPQATSLNGAIANPSADATGDCGGEAYVTGLLAGSSSGEFDVDGGFTELRSPAFDLTGMVAPAIRYQRWFHNGGGQGGVPNDRLVISLTNGTTTAVVENVTTSGSSWQEVTFDVAAIIQPTADMRFVARASDDAPGHVVEAGIDRFEVFDLATVQVPEVRAASFRVWPNPSTGTVFIHAPRGIHGLVLSDVSGRIIEQGQLVVEDGGAADIQLSPGAYLLRLMVDGIGPMTAKVLVH
jgi:choice-of-anchor B domain-containing protein